MTTPTTTNETAEQWADHIIETIFCDGVKVADDHGLRLDNTIRDAIHAELVATRRDAQAYRALPPLKPGERYIVLANPVEAEPFYIEE